MLSFSYSTSEPSFNDPIYDRTHFLGRVASDGSGLEYQHELLKRRASRINDMDRWNANWLAPVTHIMSYDSDETSDTDDDVLDAQAQSSNMSTLPPHFRSRASTLPPAFTSNPSIEVTRARSMTAPHSAATSSSSSFETHTLRRNRSTIGSTSRLMPARPLSIDTAQPLRLSSANVSALSGEASLTVNVPSPVAAVGSSPKTCSPPVVRIECSESDGSCHGDAGDQDPEAQLAAGIIRLREQRRSNASSKSQRRVGSKRRSPTSSSRSTHQQPFKVFDDMDSDEAQAIRKHGGNFVLRLAEMVLDFGSTALEKLVVSDSDDAQNEPESPLTQPTLQPRRRSSTTPQELSVEAGELLRRRRERIGTLLPGDNAVGSNRNGRPSLPRTLSIPKVLSLPLINPSASLRALTSSTASTPVTPSAAPIHLHPGFGFTKMSDEPSKYREINALDEVGPSLSRQSYSLYTHSSSVVEVVPEPGHVSPLWRQ